MRKLGLLGPPLITLAITTMATATNPTFDELDRIQNNTTALHTTRAPPWVPAPNTRGTSDILTSCLLTLFACIYTALHLNIPESGSGFLSLLATKTIWSVGALFAPELVLYLAFSQYLQARELAKHLRQLQGTEAAAAIHDHDEGQGLLTKTRPCAFDLKYGFFAVMGGFVMGVPGSRRPPQTLSPKGVRKLAEVNMEPFMIPRSDIDDRSKADTLQKALVLFQVSWMALQCIARKVLDLPLTLLELHTMVHVACAMCMYAFWLKVRTCPHENGRSLSARARLTSAGVCAHP
jgi:hypothetical protein